tara:strand:+ start:2395 stop:3612 length:1218 start_codon:yes stop_codon:yes gene_type:complete
MNSKIVNKCQICNLNLSNFLNLGKQPLCDDLTIKPNSSKFYKLQIKFCKNCLTAFQTYNVDKTKLFPKQYHYRSANTKDVLLGMEDLVKKIIKLKKNLNNKVVLDIGCNDGSLLDIFKRKGSKTFGIEPTGAYQEAKKKGHKVFNKYLDVKSANIIKNIVKKIDVITFTNVFAHIENFNELIESLKILITNETLLVIENHYLVEVIKKNQFDTFYHEHPRTYSLNSFDKISNLLNLKILKYNFVKRYNGNIRVFLGHSSARKNSKMKIDLYKEKKIIKNMKNFQKIVNKWKLNKKLFLTKLTKKFGPLPAKAFPGRASIIINLLGLNKNTISHVYEKNFSLKTNKFVPGTDIKILKEKFFNYNERKKGIIINLAWHISSEIRYYVKKNLKFNGKIIDIISDKDFK